MLFRELAAASADADGAALHWPHLAAEAALAQQMASTKAPQTPLTKQTSLTNFFVAPPKPPPGPGRPAGSQKKKKRGRPTKPSGLAQFEITGQKRPREGDMPEEPQPADEEIGMPGMATPGEVEPAPMRLQPKVNKVARVYYSKGEALIKLKQAVHDWDSKSGMYLQLDGLQTGLKNDAKLERFARLVGIPYNTFRKYACPDMDKRREIGSSVGRPSSVLDTKADEFIIDVVRRKDRANEGINRGEMAQMVQDLNPDLSVRASLNKTDKLRKQHASVLTGIVSAQASTTKRTAITVEQQYRWHEVRPAPCPCASAPAPQSLTFVPCGRMSNLPSSFCARRTPACPTVAAPSGTPPATCPTPPNPAPSSTIAPDAVVRGAPRCARTYPAGTRRAVCVAPCATFNPLPCQTDRSELMEHFVFGGDETGLQASGGDVRIIGDKAKKKHEVQTANSRLSVTLYRSGNAGGSDGPTAFMPPGAPPPTNLTPTPTVTLTPEAVAVPCSGSILLVATNTTLATALAVSGPYSSWRLLRVTLHPLTPTPPQP